MLLTERAICGAVLLTVAAVFASGAWMDADEAPQRLAGVEADPEIQAQLRRTLDAMEEDRIAAYGELRRLEELAGDGPQLVEQVGLFVSRNRGDEAMLVHFILHPCLAGSMDIDDATIVRGLAPFLDAEDRPLGDFVDDAFSMIDNASPPLLPTRISPANYGPYRDYIKGNLKRGEPIPAGFSKFIYRRAPEMELFAFIEAHQQNNPQRPEMFREELWSEHVVSDAVWKKEHGFTEKFAEAKPEAIAELEVLSKHETWWVRLYMAEILYRHPEFRTPELVERLKTDEHQLVREAITREKPEPKKPKPGFFPPERGTDSKDNGTGSIEADFPPSTAPQVDD
ncbi:MAG: hypothetical protein ACREQV_27005 [Candidatus Binatia bacterium]